MKVRVSRTAPCVQFYTIPIFQQSYKTISVAPDMLKGQPKSGICSDYLINALFNQEKIQPTRSRPNVYKQDCPSSDEGQQAGREEEHLVGLYTSAFQKPNVNFVSKA